MEKTQLYGRVPGTVRIIGTFPRTTGTSFSGLGRYYFEHNSEKTRSGTWILTFKMDNLFMDWQNTGYVRYVSGTVPL
jgi:hypothetical protein